MHEHIHTQFQDLSPVSLVEINVQGDDWQNHIRPQSFADYPGQERICENLTVYTQAAKKRGKMLDHCLFHGPPGLGKTTLAKIVANMMGCGFKITAGPAIDKAADLMGLLANLEPHSVLFIDEIHRLAAPVEEILYSAMEDLRLDILVGQGPTTRTVSIDLPPFCLIGATTRAGSISAPLRDRFGIQEHLDYYSSESLTKIILRTASLMQVTITCEAAQTLAKRSRGTPRIANQLLRRVIDFATVAEQETIDTKTICHALERLGVDAEGLSLRDKAFLNVIQERYNGGPVGLDAIAAALNEDKQTLEDMYEPYLVHRGFVLRTARGRMLSKVGADWLRKSPINIAPRQAPVASPVL